MNVSGILISCPPTRVKATSDEVELRPWAQVHSSSPEGRLIVTIEAVDTSQSMERLKELQGLPEVTSAEMIVYCCEDEPRPLVEGKALRSVSGMDH